MHFAYGGWGVARTPHSVKCLISHVNFSFQLAQIFFRARHNTSDQDKLRRPLAARVPCYKAVT